MNFFSKLKFLFSNNFDSFIRQYLQGEDIHIIGTDGIGDEVAMKTSALFGCFRVLAETLASVPVKEYQKLKNGDRAQTSDTPLHELLTGRVNIDMSAYNFFEAMTYQICAGGNGLAQIAKDSSGRVIGLFPMDYRLVQIQINKDTNRLEYKLPNGNILTTEQVFHVPGPSMDGYIGMSILEYATQAIALSRSYETFSKKFFDNGAQPSGIFEHPGLLNKEAYLRLKEDLQEKYTGLMNTGKPMLLEHGLQYKHLTLRPIDTQLLQNRRFQIEDICRFCRVPPHMIQDLSRSTNNNIEHQSLDLIRFTMLPYFRRFEEAINNQLLTERERMDKYYYEFDLNTLLRGDSESMARSFATGRQWGWYSVNDVRKMLNMNSIEHGDIYLQPVNLVEAGTPPPVPSSPVQESKNSDDDKEVYIEDLK